MTGVKPVDMHVHIVGNGARGSGCWLRPTGWYSLLGRYICHHIGLNITGFDDPDFDEKYVARLLDWVRQSSLQRVIILACDHAYRADGQILPVGVFHVPNDYVLQLARQHPEFLPAVSIHPARPDALDELERCAAAGAVMMKCLPNCQNIDCNDRRYRKFWERMAALQIPLLAHTGGEHTLPVIEPKYADPRILQQPLDCGVTCIAAHCAARGFLDPDYFPVFAQMTTRHPNLYGDISAFHIPARSKHFPDALQPPLVERILHGSDYPVPVIGAWAWARGLIDWTTYRRWENCPNPLERDYQLKRALGYPPAVFTRIQTLLPPHARCTPV